MNTQFLVGLGTGDGANGNGGGISVSFYNNTSLKQKQVVPQQW